MTEDTKAVLWCIAFAILCGFVLLYLAEDEVERQQHECNLKRARQRKAAEKPKLSCKSDGNDGCGDGHEVK